MKDITPQESLFGSASNNSRFRSFKFRVCILCTHWRETRNSKLAVHAQLRVQLGTVNGMYRIYLLSARRIVHFKHVVFKEGNFPIGTVNKPSVRKREVQIRQEQSTADGSWCGMIPLKGNGIPEVDDKDDIIVSSCEEESDESADEDDASVDDTEHEKDEMKMESSFSTRRNRNPPMRFSLNVLSRS